MENYRLFDQTVSFSDSAERYYDTLDLFSDAVFFVSNDFIK